MSDSDEQDKEHPPGQDHAGPAPDHAEGPATDAEGGSDVTENDALEDEYDDAEVTEGEVDAPSIPPVRARPAESPYDGAAAAGGVGSADAEGEAAHVGDGDVEDASASAVAAAGTPAEDDEDASAEVEASTGESFVEAADDPVETVDDDASVAPVGDGAPDEDASRGEEAPAEAQDAAAVSRDESAASGVETSAEADSAGSAGSGPSADSVGKETAAAAASVPADRAPADPPRRRWALISAISAAVLVVGGYFLLAAWQSGSLPSEARAAGVDLGGLDREAAVAALSEGTEDRADAEITVAAGESEAAFDPEAAGLSLDVDATVDRALGFSADPRVVWQRLFGDGEIAPVLVTDEATFGPVLEETSADLSEDPVDATLAYEETTPEITESAEGMVITPEELATAIDEQWLRTDEPVAVEPQLTDPEISTEEAERVRSEIAEPAVSADVEIDAEEDDDGDEHTLVVSPAVIAGTLSFEPESGQLTPEFDAETLRDLVFDDNPEVGSQPTDASFEVDGDDLTVVPSQTGVGADAEEFAEAVSEAMTADDRSAEIALTTIEPDFTTEDAEDADFSDTVSEFSTPYSSEPNRDNNLQVASDKVSGTVVQPGEQFSLNEALGQRTAANGYQPAGVISEGQMREDFGGGVSQVSTTLFNAAFFAGFDLDEHQAHSRYISRYPEGRETTLDWSSIDLKFTNNADTPVVLDMHLEDGEVVARVLGVKTVDVEASASERFAYTSPGTVRESGSSCQPQSPSQGWSITIHRTITDADSGDAVSEDDFTTVYRPVNRVVCED